jgi:hypothetical protein
MSEAERCARDVQRAGMALACPYSSSAEFEAALIRARRDAGVYGPKRTRRHVATLVLAAAGLVAASWIAMAAFG